ncbi:hypothetical protein [Vogesella sp. LIG4]|uniref:hypothetical protein n=1 Tax=Vogesella sp. LIG4 TaxID=1192162 RepID=UPI00081F84DC|nr:hypothetical protein [Vogesella sp. LIG4]SCK18697.1 cyanophycin synthetase [Vogesella sp. LIG4]
MSYHIERCQPPHAGFHPQWHQPWQQLRLRSGPLPAGVDWPQLDAWLQACFALPASMPAAAPGSDAASQVAAWGERVLTLAAQLLRFARVPVFSSGELQLLTPLTDGWQLALRVPWVPGVEEEHFLRCYQAAAIVLAGYAANPGHFGDRQALQRQLEASVIGPICRAMATDDGSFALLQAAHQASVPWQWLGDGAYRLGWGARRGHLQHGGVDGEAMSGIQVSAHKAVTRRWLQQAGLPVAPQQLVRGEAEAQAAWQALGGVVAVKPAASEGDGVSLNVASADALRAAHARAAACSPEVVLEPMLPGDCYHVQIVAGRALFVIRRQGAALLADGEHDIAHCLAQENARRAASVLWQRLPPLPDDAEATACLAAQGWHWHSVPAAGSVLYLRRLADNRHGAWEQDASADAHPDNLALAEQAASRLGLLQAGVDILSPDIRQPWHANGAVVLEVNHAPQLGPGTLYRRHLPAMVQALWPQQARIALEVLVGDQPLPALRQRQAELAAQGVAAFICTVDGSWGPQGDAWPQTCGDVFTRVQALLAEVAPGALLVGLSDDAWLQHGVPVDRISRLHALQPEAPRWQPLLQLLRQYLPAEECAA